MTKKKRRTSWTQYLPMALFMLIGFLCGILMAEYIQNIAQDMPFPAFLGTLLGLILVLYAALLVQLILHEAGHLVFGLLSRYRFCSFRIFHLMWIKQDGRIRLRKLSLAGTGGQCLMAPPDLVNGRIPVILYNLGGSLMNLIASVLFGLLYLLTRSLPLLSTIFLMLVVIGVVYAMMNGIPLRLGMVDNDGYNALSLRREPEAMQAFWLQMKIIERISQGVRLKNMPDEWFTPPSDQAMQNSMIATRGVYLANRMMDAREFDQAREWMTHLLAISSGMVGVHRNLLLCDMIFLELIGDCRADVLASFYTPELKSFLKQMKTNPSVLRTQYAYSLLFEKDIPKADGFAAKFHVCAATFPYPSEIQAERELMDIAQKYASIPTSQPEVDR